MRNRGFHKKKAIRYASQYHWETYQAIRNKVNIEMRKTKSKFYCKKIEDCAKTVDLKKSWSLINSLLGKNSRSTVVSELTVNDTVISDSKLIAESFNDYFINIGPKLTAESDDELYAEDK